MSFKEILKDKGVNTFARIHSNSKIHRILNAFGIIKIEKGFDDAFENVISHNLIKISRCMQYDECLQVQKDIMSHIIHKTKCPQGTRAAIDYMLTEIWDNAGCHGYKCYKKSTYPKPIYICAFSYDNFIEVAILDRGQGIHESLKQKREYLDLSAGKAIEICILRGVSGHPENSPGFGLYSAVEFTKGNKGILNIWSSGKLLSVKNGQIDIDKGQLKIGTLVAFRINSNLETPFENILTHYSIDEYEENFLEDIIKGK